MARRITPSFSVPRARKVAHEAAGEAIARAGGVVHLLQRKRRHGKDAAVVHHHGAVFAALDHQRLGAELEDMPRRAQQIVLVREHARLGVVDHQDLRVRQNLAQFGGRLLDPIVHGVERDHARLAVDLREHGMLQRGIDIGEEDVLGRAEGVRQLGLECGEDVQLGGQGDALVGIGAVAPGPEKRFARGVLQAGDIDAAALEDRGVGFGEIVADHADQIYVREVAGRHGKISRRAAQRALHLAERRLQRIERHRTHHKK